jgi:spore coat polysaccharide biosynthesis protein SpsF
MPWEVRMFGSKVVAIIQARMSSTRLPGKALMNLAGKNSLTHIIDRVKASGAVDEICVATTTNRKDLRIKDYCHEILKVNVYQGSEEDVLGRVHKAAEKMDAKIIVDITADCPMIDIEHLKVLVREVKNNGALYASNVITRTFPDGYDIQVYTFKLLSVLNKIVVRDTHRCHVGWNAIEYITQLTDCLGCSKGNLRYSSLPAREKLCHPEWGLTLDTEKDFELLSRIFTHFREKYRPLKEDWNLFSCEEVVDYLNKNKRLLAINKNITRKIPGQG